MAMFELTNKDLQEIYELQKKLFTTSTENNPYLKNNNSNPDLNKGLNTDSKTIIGAINDIFAIATSVRDVNTDFIDRFNRIIGNEKLNPELVKRLGAIGNNFYDALFKSWDRANDGYEKADALEEQVEVLKAKLDELIKGEDSSNKDLFNTYEDKRFTGNTFTISSTPISDSSASFYINGVHYDNDCFTVADDNKTFTWTADDFEIVSSYKEATEYDCLNSYYSKDGENYKLESNLTREAFNSGVFYEIDEDLSDKIIVRYNTYGIENDDYYKSLYDISLLNSVTTSIGRDIYQNNALVNDYEWSNISIILNKNLLGSFKYTDEGKVRIVLDSRNTSKFSVISNKNWDSFGAAAKVFIGGNVTVTSFDEFCNFITGETENTIKWVSFFAFEIGGYANIFMITDKTNVLELADSPAYGDWFYGWDEEKSGDS